MFVIEAIGNVTLLPFPAIRLKFPKGATPLMDESTVSMLTEANLSSKSRHIEQARHNQKIEEINQEKLDIERQRLNVVSWKAKDNEMKYKCNMVTRDAELHNSGMSDDAILRFIPSLKEYIDAKNGVVEPPAEPTTNAAVAEVAEAPANPST